MFFHFLKSKHIVAALLFLVTLSGCSMTAGSKLSALDGIESQSDALRVIPLGSTMAEVEAKIGPPGATAVHGDTTVWGYTKATDPLNGKSLILGALGQTTINTKSMSISFSPEGVVTQVSYTAFNRV